jgi:cobalt-zinc-cadmium efflux system protein
MGDGHDHSHASISAGTRHRGRLAAAFGVLFVLMVVEVITGLSSRSLALLSDAGHTFTDVLGLGMALAAIQLAVRGCATGWQWVDPAVGVGIGLFILPRTWRLGARAVRILVQAAPDGLDLEASPPTWAPSPVWSTCTTCTCGPSPPTWTWPPRT